MATEQEILSYVVMLPDSDDFERLLSEDNKQAKKFIFGAAELLKDNYSEDLITARIISLQTLFMYEASSEGYATMTRQGVSELRNQEVTIKKSAAMISPDVIAKLGEPQERDAGDKPQTAYVGRLTNRWA